MTINIHLWCYSVFIFLSHLISHIYRYALIFIICQCDIKYLIGWFSSAWRKLVKNVLMPQKLIIGVLLKPSHCSGVYSFYYASKEWHVWDAKFWKFLSDKFQTKHSPPTSASSFSASHRTLSIAKLPVLGCTIPSTEVFSSLLTGFETMSTKSLQNSKQFPFNRY